MKKIYLFMGLIFAYGFVAVAMNNKVYKEKLKGKWDVKVADAPVGYRDYVVDIKEKNGTYSADVFFVNSDMKIINQALTKREGKITGNVSVNNKKTEISIWEEKGEVKGMVINSSTRKLPITFTRVKD